MTNEGEQTLYQVDVEASPKGGEFANLPAGTASENSVASIAELKAGETVRFAYQVPTEAGTGGARVEGSATATGWYGDTNLEDSVTASASAGVGVVKGAATENGRLPINVLIAGLAALALFAAVGLLVLARRRR